MNDPERQLNEMKPAAPSEEFERRMAALFENARPRPAFWRRGIVVWQAAAACMLCGVSGFAASNYLRAQTPIPEPQIRTEYYVIPATGHAVRGAFDLTDTIAYRSAAPPPMQVIIETFEGGQRS